MCVINPIQAVLEFFERFDSGSGINSIWTNWVLVVSVCLLVLRPFQMLCRWRLNSNEQCLFTASIYKSSDENSVFGLSKQIHLAARQWQRLKNFQKETDRELSTSKWWLSHDQVRIVVVASFLFFSVWFISIGVNWGVSRREMPEDTKKRSWCPSA